MDKVETFRWDDHRYYHQYRINQTLQLFFLRGPGWDLACAVKILTDPFQNIAICWKSPLALLRGERLDPLGAHRQAGA